MTGARVEIEGLVHTVGVRTVRVDRLVLEPGRAYALWGPNGAGKTTLLRILAGLVEPAEGRVAIGGGPTTLVHQQPYLFRRSALANVVFGLRARGVRRAEARRRATEALGAVGLEGIDRRAARSLSGGEAQRVALARAMAVDPRVLLLDEPAANLDASGLAVLRDLFARWRAQRGPTILWATPVEPDPALADDVLRIADGVVTVPARVV